MKEWSSTSHMTHNTSYQRRVFPDNQLHWAFGPQNYNTLIFIATFSKQTQMKLRLQWSTSLAQTTRRRRWKCKDL